MKDAAIRVAFAMAADAVIFWSVLYDKRNSASIRHPELHIIIGFTALIDIVCLSPIWFPIYLVKKGGDFVYSEYIEKKEDDPISIKYDDGWSHVYKF